MLSLVLSFASKESTIPRRGGSPIHSRRSRRVRPPPRGNFLRQSCLSSCKQGGFPLAPLHPLRGVGVPMQVYAPAGAPKGFPRGKQSARFALPCAPLVVCLNSGSLTAFGGCIHWIPASLRSPLETFGSPTEAIERPIGLQALLPRRSRRTPARGSAPAHSRISFLRSQNSAPERKGNAHALFCRW